MKAGPKLAGALLPWLAVAIWAGVIFYFSSLGHASLSSDVAVDWVSRKLAHLFVFGALAVLIAVAASRTAARPWLVALLAAAVYGGLDEIHQAFVIGRSPLLTDVLIDAAGASLGVLAWLIAVRWRAGQT